MMNREDAYKVFCIKPPFTEQQLKSHFRKLAMLNHPDKGGNPEVFIQIREAFEVLQHDAGKDRIFDPIQRTVNGVLLSSLGKGLKTSARPCNGCSGKGYQETTFEILCPYCNTMDYIFKLLRNMGIERCKHCNNTGWLTGEKKYIICNSCEGSGEIALFNPLFIRNSMTQKERKKQK